MRIHTLLRYEWDGSDYQLVHEEGFEYSGAVALCDRGDSKATSAQGRQQSAQDQANAQAALAKTNSSLSAYDDNVKNFMKFGRATYGANGAFMRDQNTLANTTAAAGQNNLKGNLALNAARTGENTSGYAGTVEESGRSSERDLTNQLAGADSDRLSKLTAIEGIGLDASKFPAQIQSGIYGSSMGGSTGNLSASASAAQTPGFWDVFAPALAGAAGTAAAGFCPMEGSLIQMADGTVKRAEDVRKGDWVASGSTLSPPNLVLEDSEPQTRPCFELTTKRGNVHAGSDTHTIGLATGGYVYMPEAVDKSIITEWGGDLVLAVRSLGVRRVIPLKVGGSHSYLADGIFCLA